MSWPTVPASGLMLKRGGSVNPANYPDETFELLSIPAFDKGEPEIVEGKAIGSSKSCVQPNDVLLSKIVPHIKRCWVVPEPKASYRQIGSGEWIIFRSDKVHPPFLRHFLTSDIFHKQFMNTTAGVGGSLVRARPAGVGSIEIPLPPLSEQRRIAAILDKAASIRRKRQNAIQLAGHFLRAVFLEIFGDPVTNPKGWPMARVDKLCTIVRGSSPRPQGDPRFYGGPVPRLMVADLTRDGKLVTPKIDSLTEEGAKKSRPVEAGTVVMAVSGNVGLTSVLAIDACIHDGFVAFKNIDEMNVRPEFLCELMMFLKSTHASRQAGAIFQNLTTSQIKEMEIPMPPLHLQNKFISISNKVFDLYKCGGEELFDSLAAEFFSA